MTSPKLSSVGFYANLITYSLTHMVVDAICIAVVCSIVTHQPLPAAVIFGFVVLYNVLAFGLQSIFGLLVDYRRVPRVVSVLGCVLVGVAASLAPFQTLVAIIMAGLGNALFHVGGGVIALSLDPHRASVPGVFVAPGALGVFLGLLIGKSDYLAVGPVWFLLIILISVLLILPLPVINYQRTAVSSATFSTRQLILVLALFSIAVRALVGSVLVFPWTVGNFELLTLLTVSVVLGKGLGGIVADKFGWLVTAVNSLLLSVPCLLLGPQYPTLGLLGIFLFNFTMPITLTLIANILPGRIGFAFGLTTLALVIGVLPTYTSLKSILGSPGWILVIITLSALALFGSLRRYLIYYKSSAVKTSSTAKITPIVKL